MWTFVSNVRTQTAEAARLFKALKAAQKQLRSAQGQLAKARADATKAAADAEQPLQRKKGNARGRRQSELRKQLEAAHARVQKMKAAESTEIAQPRKQLASARQRAEEAMECAAAAEAA